MNFEGFTGTTPSRVFWFIALCAVPSVSWAIAPPSISDEELARYPIIVVAKWDKTSFRAHYRYSTNSERGKVITAFESYTELNVLRVIKGPMEPGVRMLKIGYGVSWSTNGDQVTSGTSTLLLGEVDTVAEPNLWFLKTSTSWDANDATNYLTLDYYRAIQPLVLEKYFAALPGGKPEAEVRALLASTNATAVSRGLSYACGGDWPWPNDSEFNRLITGSAPLAKKRVEYADAIEAPLKRGIPKETRPCAVVVYADLAGAKGVPFLRRLLQHEDPGVALPKHSPPGFRTS